jgi:hypothetical protein
MTNRGSDAIYFALLLAVAGIGYFTANWSGEEADGLPLPDFKPLPLTFEVPFELPFYVVKFKTGAPRSLALSSNMERALVEVRASLLESSRVVEVRTESTLLAAAE